MSRWALLFSFVLIISGCTLLPTESHREVTLETIDALVGARMHSLQQQLSELDKTSCESIILESNSIEYGESLRQLEQKLDDLLNRTIPFQVPECSLSESLPAYDGRVVIGEAEWIYLPILERHFEARVDSGAATSSLSATQIERFERDGKRWVRFQLQHDDEEDDGSLTVEAEVVRTAVIRQVSSDETTRRPVIRLVLNLGQSIQQEAEFTLTDRSQMSYPILLGRQFLRDVVLIDVGRKFIHNKYIPETVIDDINTTQP